MITMRLVLCALSSHVAQCWWSQHRMTVHLDGPRSIMGIPNDCILLSCEPKGLPLCWQRPRVCSWHWAIRTTMAPCCTTWKGIVALFHVFPMFSIESWYALFAPGENKLSSRLATFKKLYRLILSIKRIMWEINVVERRTLWCKVCFNFLIGFLQRN